MWAYQNQIKYAFSCTVTGLVSKEKYCNQNLCQSKTKFEFIKSNKLIENVMLKFGKRGYVKWKTAFYI